MLNKIFSELKKTLNLEKDSTESSSDLKGVSYHEMSHDRLNVEDITSQKGSLPPFHSIYNYSYLDVECVNDEKLNHTENFYQLKSEKDSSNNINISVKNGILFIKTDSTAKNLFKRLRKKSLIINVKKLKEVANYGIGNMNISSLVSSKIIQSGAGNIVIKDSTATNIEITSIGNLTIEQHEADNITINHSGTGNLNINKGYIKNLSAYSSSIGDINVYATIESLKANSEATGNQNYNNITSHIDIRLSSIGNVKCLGPSAEYIKLTNNGTGDINAKNIHTQASTILLNGIGNINLSGQTNKLKIISSGVGNINGSQFMAHASDIYNTGLGNVKIKPLDKIFVEQHGKGNVFMKGNANLEEAKVSVSQDGSVKGRKIKVKNSDYKKYGEGDISLPIEAKSKSKEENRKMKIK